MNLVGFGSLLTRYARSEHIDRMTVRLESGRSADGVRRRAGIRYLLPLLLLLAACSGRVEAGLVGSWELMVPNPAGVARWVWDIHLDGTYTFHAEGPGNVPSHSGRFEAKSGQYILESTTMLWADTGSYRLAGDTLYGTGKLGSAAWHRIVVSGGAKRSPPINVARDSVPAGARVVEDSDLAPRGPPAKFDPRAIYASLRQSAIDKSFFAAPFTDPRTIVADVDADGVRDGEIGQVNTTVRGPGDSNHVTFRIYRDRRAAEAAYTALAVYDSPRFRAPTGILVISQDFTFHEDGESRCVSRYMMDTSSPTTFTCYLLVVRPSEEAVIIEGGLQERVAAGRNAASNRAFDRADNLVLAGLKYWTVFALGMQMRSIGK